ncbi:MAG: tRNA pseudouridine(38-40) synthase TruA [Candidatus Bruticola sp.]
MSENSGNIVYRVDISYDGAAFSGFQSQAKAKELLTVQDILEEKLRFVFAQPISIRVAGRTDAGVHALGQVFSFRTCVNRSEAVLFNALNSLLPDTIKVLRVSKEADSFHARFTAKNRVYEYLIKDESDVDPFFRDRILYVKQKLNLEAMRSAARYLVGSHDFASFGSQVPKGEPTIRRMNSITLSESRVEGPGPFAGIGRIVVLRIEANAFLRRMVRMICGSLIKVGIGQWPPTKIREILAQADPSCCAPPAHPGGLYLKSVAYAQDRSPVFRTSEGFSCLDEVIGGSVMENEFEAKLNAAADKLGLAMKAAPEAEREILKGMYADYQRFVKERPNDNLDISALFAMGIISHNEIKSEDVIEAAVEYIDTDLEYCRWRQKSMPKAEEKSEA